MSEAATVRDNAATHRYGIVRRVSQPYAEAVQRVRETLKQQGFGVLTEIDVRATLKEKLGEEMDDYIILGACNPALAHQAITGEPDIGLLLPCNVVVYREAGTGQTVVGAVDPQTLVTLTGNEALSPIAGEVSRRLTAALDAL